MRLFFLSLLIFLPTLSHAAEIITLKDGSKIHGDLISLNNGVYTIKTTAMGTVNLTAGNIVNIVNENALRTLEPAGTFPNPSTPIQAPLPILSRASDALFQEKQTQLMSNPAALSAIAEMAKDPEIMKILSDPALIQSVTSRDINGVSNNPKTQELLNNPKMKALLDKLQSSSQ